MSDDELEKLAAAMRDFKPSKAARERGMDAAMAAFGAEFTPETVSETNAAKETSQLLQGSSVDARPTGETTRTKPVATLWSTAMAKLDRLFNPKAMAMMGSCTAALIAAMIYLPNVDTSQPEPVIDAIEERVSTISPDETLVPSAAVDEKESLTSAVDESIDEAVEPQAAPPEGTPEPAAKPIDEASIERSTEERVTDIAKATLPADAAEVEAEPNLEPKLELLSEPAISTRARVESTTPKSVEKESIGGVTVKGNNIFVIQRRAVKIPASIQERVIPAVTKQETRQVLKKAGTPTGRRLPAVTKQVERRVVKIATGTQERIVPAVTQDITGRFKMEDGTFKNVTATIIIEEAYIELVDTPVPYETVTETVVVLPERDEYVAGTAEYETVIETIVVQDASTELFMVPAVYEMVRETIELLADGSVRVLASESVASPSKPPAIEKVAETSGGILSVSDVISKIRSEASSPDAIGSEERKFSARSTGDVAAFREAETIAPPAPIVSAPPPPAIVSNPSFSDCLLYTSPSPRDRG